MGSIVLFLFILFILWCNDLLPVTFIFLFLATVIVAAFFSIKKSWLMSPVKQANRILSKKIGYTKDSNDYVLKKCLNIIGYREVKELAEDINVVKIYSSSIEYIASIVESREDIIFIAMYLEYSVENHNFKIPKSTKILKKHIIDENNFLVLIKYADPAKSLLKVDTVYSKIIFDEEEKKLQISNRLIELFISSFINTLYELKETTHGEILIRKLENYKKYFIKDEKDKCVPSVLNDITSEILKKIDFKFNNNLKNYLKMIDYNNHKQIYTDICSSPHPEKIFGNYVKKLSYFLEYTKSNDDAQFISRYLEYSVKTCSFTIPSSNNYYGPQTELDGLWIFIKFKKGYDLHVNLISFDIRFIDIQNLTINEILKKTFFNSIITKLNLNKKIENYKKIFPSTYQQNPIINKCLSIIDQFKEKALQKGLDIPNNVKIVIVDDNLLNQNNENGKNKILDQAKVDLYNQNLLFSP